MFHFCLLVASQISGREAPPTTAKSYVLASQKETVHWLVGPKGPSEASEGAWDLQRPLWAFEGCQGPSKAAGGLNRLPGAFERLLGTPEGLKKLCRAVNGFWGPLSVLGGL